MSVCLRALVDSVEHARHKRFSNTSTVSGSVKRHFPSIEIISG